MYFPYQLISFIVEFFLFYLPFPMQPPLISRYRNTNRLYTCYVIDTGVDDFLGMVALNHASLWVSSIPYVTLENAHVSLKWIHLGLVSLSHPRCDLGGVPSYRTINKGTPSQAWTMSPQCQLVGQQVLWDQS